MKTPKIKISRHGVDGHVVEVNASKILHRENEEVMPHKHACIEVIIVQKGAGVHRIGDEEFYLSPGSVFFIPPNKVHFFEKISQLHLLNLNISPRMCKRIITRVEKSEKIVSYFKNGTCSENPPFSIGIRGLNIINSLVEQLAFEQLFHSAEYELMQDALTMQIIALLARASREFPTDIVHCNFADVMNYIERNFQHDITLDELSHKFGFCKTNLNIMFKKMTGRSPIDWLIYMRIKKAKEFLSTSNMPMSAIAESCGFCDASYFAKQFRKYCGKTPRQYRSSIHGIYSEPYYNGSVTRITEV